MGGVEPLYPNFMEEMIHDFNIGDKQLARIERQCKRVLKAIGPSNLHLHHLVAVELFMDDYRFGTTLKKLMKCLLSNNDMQIERRSLYHWKKMLSEAVEILSVDMDPDNCIVFRGHCTDGDEMTLRAVTSVLNSEINLIMKDVYKRDMAPVDEYVYVLYIL